MIALGPLGALGLPLQCPQNCGHGFGCRAHLCPRFARRGFRHPPRVRLPKEIELRIAGWFRHARKSPHACFRSTRSYKLPPSNSPARSAPPADLPTKTIAVLRRKVCAHVLRENRATRDLLFGFGRVRASSDPYGRSPAVCAPIACTPPARAAPHGDRPLAPFNRFFSPAFTARPWRRLPPDTRRARARRRRVAAAR